MICYRLRCVKGHEFEGWFRDSAAFGTQSTTGLLSCPECGTPEVTQALMAPAVVTSPRRAPRQDVAPPPPGIPDAVRAALMRVRAEVERTCDDVGDRFAEEMVQMHRGDREERGIYGRATAEEQEALHEQGIEFGMLPWLPLADS